MQHRLVIAGLAATFAAPPAFIQPASAAIAFTCDSVIGSAAVSPGLVHDKRPQSLSSGPTAPAGSANITVGSTSDAEVKGNDTSDKPKLSADGTKVAFASFATNLDLSDTDALEDVYVKDLSTGDLTLVSTSDAGVKGNGVSTDPSLSPYGNQVAFWSYATNLDPADTDTTADIYVKDLATGDITLASTSDSGMKGNGESTGPWLSADGTEVGFHSHASNLDPADTDTTFDVYVKNLETGDIALVSTSDIGVKGNRKSIGPSLSADGTKVGFVSDATNLDPADPDRLTDTYVKDLSTGDLALVSTSDSGVKSNGGGVGLLSVDGMRVVISSTGTNLDPADTDDILDVYVKNLATGDITLASTSDAGAKANGFTGAQSLSADGHKVAFNSTATNLDPADTDTTFDIYAKDLVTGDLTLASVSDTGVKGNGLSIGASLSADGTKLAFDSRATNLDPADTDLAWDVFINDLPAVPTSIDIAGCSNGQTGTASIVDIRSYGPRPLGCPTSLGGAAGNDYADTTPILVGATLSMTIDWASGPNSYGVAAAKAGPTGTQWRFRLAISASPGHDTPATNQYLPAAGSGFTKTRLQGKLNVSALDSFNCTTGVDDPISWLSLANNGTWVAKTS